MIVIKILSTNEYDIKIKLEHKTTNSCQNHKTRHNFATLITSNQ